MSFLTFEDVSALRPFVARWDELAVESARPYCSPAWILAWWRHVAPPEGVPRFVVVFDGSEVVGVGPFFFEERRRCPTRYRLMAASLATPVEPLARKEREGHVAAALAQALATARPRAQIISFEGTSGQMAWPNRIVEMWPEAVGRPWVYRDYTRIVPTMELSLSSVEEWFQSKSRNFRQQMRRSRRKLEDQGARFKVVDALETTPEDIDVFSSLHRSRWEDRGGSEVITESVTAMLKEVAAEMAGSLRFRLSVIEIRGKTISSHLFLAAGGRVSYWLGGFDETWASYHPGQIAILAAIEHAWRSGDDRVDLGYGDQEYKARFADESEEVTWTTLLPRGRSHLRTRLSLAPAQARRKLSEHISPATKQRILTLLRSLRRGLEPRDRD